MQQTSTTAIAVGHVKTPCSRYVGSAGFAGGGGCLTGASGG